MYVFLYVFVYMYVRMYVCVYVYVYVSRLLSSFSVGVERVLAENVQCCAIYGRIEAFQII